MDRLTLSEASYAYWSNISKYDNSDFYSDIDDSELRSDNDPVDFVDERCLSDNPTRRAEIQLPEVELNLSLNRGNIDES